jgi:hypothetical protein
MQMETRFKMLTKSHPDDAKQLWAKRSTTRCHHRVFTFTNIWRSVKA